MITRSAFLFSYGRHIFPWWVVSSAHRFPLYYRWYFTHLSTLPSRVPSFSNTPPLRFYTCLAPLSSKGCARNPEILIYFAMVREACSLREHLIRGYPPATIGAPPAFWYHLNVGGSRVTLLIGCGSWRGDGHLVIPPSINSGSYLLTGDGVQCSSWAAMVGEFLHVASTAVLKVSTTAAWSSSTLLAGRLICQ